MTAPDLCRAETARAVARRFRVSPHHDLGQNFLVDAGVRDRIVETLPFSQGCVLEIGSGLGALSQGLLAAGLHLIGLEVDGACVAALRMLQADYPAFRVVQGDALRADPSALGLTHPYVVVANLPYQITGAILPRLLGWVPAPVTCHLVVQREVARRLAAKLGDWSLATLGVRLLAEVELVFDIDPAAFWPEPKVHSSLILVRPTSPEGGADPAGIMELARPIFQQRRKQLHHGLANAIGVSSARASELLEEAGIESSRRPGTLDQEEWKALSIVAGRERTG